MGNGYGYFIRYSPAYQRGRGYPNGVAVHDVRITVKGAYGIIPRAAELRKKGGVAF